MNKNNTQLEKIVQDGMVITGGHFMLDESNQAVLNQGTIDSFRKAAELYKYGKDASYQVGLGILINDIGVTCDYYDVCSTGKRDFSRESFALPQQYQEIFTELGIEAEKVDIYWEKHMRNRGHKLLRREVRKGNQAIEDFNGDHWLADEEGYGRILLSSSREHDQYGNAACPLIMAAYALEKQRRGFNQSLNIYYVGNDNTRNIPNHFVIEKGKRVAEILGRDVQVRNVYFTEEKVLTNFEVNQDA